MANKILVIAMLTVLFLNSCKETPTQESAENTTSETFKNGVDDIVTSTFTDKDGKKLELTFNNTKGTATLSLNGET
ncbi:MAG: lysozyme inhibitor, partial [Chitinophagales bacterium]|nr:lysozyme inhibitor [Chitinophagales bacterium]